MLWRRTDELTLCHGTLHGLDEHRVDLFDARDGDIPNLRSAGARSEELKRLRFAIRT